MIRIKHLSGSLQGRISSSGKQVVRIGRAEDCDVRFDAARDPKVSGHHAEFLYEDGQWFIVDTGSTNGTLVDGERIRKQRLRQGEEIQIGAGGPKVRVEFDAADGLGGSMRTEAVSLKDLPGLKNQIANANLANTAELSAISSELRQSADTQTANLARMAAKKIAEERRKAGGISSGKTMAIMVSSMKEVQRGTKTRTRKTWVKVVAAVAGVECPPTTTGTPRLTDAPIAAASCGISAATAWCRKSSIRARSIPPGSGASRWLATTRIRSGSTWRTPMTDMIDRVFLTEVTLKSVTTTIWSEFSSASSVISESCDVVSAITSSKVERSSATAERRCAVVT